MSLPRFSMRRCERLHHLLRAIWNFSHLVTIKPSLFPDVFFWYEWSKVGKLRMFWNFQNLKNVKNRIHGKETDSEKKLQYHHKYPLAQSYILFTPATWGDYCRVPTVVCPLCVQVAEVLVTFLMRLKLAVTKENFLR